MKIFFLDNVEWSSKNLWNMMSANVKANIIKQQEIEDLVAVSYIFFKKYPQKLKYNVKSVYFSFDFCWHSPSIHLDVVC